MGLFDLLKPKKLPPGDPKIQKLGLKIISKNVDSPTRYSASDSLAEIGSEEAIYCMLQRFTVVIGTHIPDEDEKTYVADKVRSFGSKSIQPVMKFLREKEQSAMALRLLKQISNPDQYLELLLELIASFDPYHSKYPDKKIQTFRELQSCADGRIIETLKPFLDDDDDDVQIAAIAAIARQNNEEMSRELLLKTLVEAEERPRVRIALCEELSKLKWRVAGFRKQVESVLPAQFYMDSKGHILTKADYNPLQTEEDRLNAG